MNTEKQKEQSRGERGRGRTEGSLGQWSEVVKVGSTRVGLERRQVLSFLLKHFQCFQRTELLLPLRTEWVAQVVTGKA